MSATIAQFSMGAHTGGKIRVRRLEIACEVSIRGAKQHSLDEGTTCERSHSGSPVRNQNKQRLAVQVNGT
jgi:hypothetical protein